MCSGTAAASSCDSNDQSTPLELADGRPVVLLDWLKGITKPGQTGSLRVWLPAAKGAKERIPARLCAVRKSMEASALAVRKLKQRAARKQTTLREVTLEHNGWIVVLTTVGEDVLSAPEVLEWYRVRWQIELAFKRLKSLGDVGHLPKRDAASSRAWVYGKLPFDKLRPFGRLRLCEASSLPRRLIALLSEKMQRHAAALSPWGGRWLEQDPPAEFLA